MDTSHGAIPVNCKPSDFVATLKQKYLGGHPILLDVGALICRAFRIALFDPLCLSLQKLIASASDMHSATRVNVADHEGFNGLRTFIPLAYGGELVSG